jgi:hypothetical protein
MWASNALKRRDINNRTEKRKIWTYAVDGSKYTSSPKVARLAYASISSVGTADYTET